MSNIYHKEGKMKTVMSYYLWFNSVNILQFIDKYINMLYI